MRDLAELPKAHLHLHLEGSMRPGTLRDLCDRDGIAVPVIEGFGDFSVFAATYVAACHTLREPADLRRLVHEVVEDAAADGCVWIEPAFYPTHHAGRLGSEEELWRMACTFGREAGARFGVGVSWIAAINRTAPLEEADRITDLAIALAADGEPIVALGLHNAEAGHPPAPFAAPFARARAAGLRATPHAGEHAGPESVAAALDVLGASRIQHGVRAIEDPDLVARLAERAVVLDVCPTSNVALSVVPSIEAHPLPALLAAGVACSLNADDSLLFGPGILDEYDTCRRALGLSDDALAAIARTSITASAAPDPVKRSALARIDDWATET